MQEELLQKISKRGDTYGGSGGLLDLLDWCGKQGISQVTQEEASFYLKYPTAPYPDFLSSRSPKA